MLPKNFKVVKFMNIENMIQGNPQALVKSVNGIMVADSLQVADSFRRRRNDNK